MSYTWSRASVRATCGAATHSSNERRRGCKACKLGGSATRALMPAIQHPATHTHTHTWPNLVR
jgi:hypothetical protein